MCCVFITDICFNFLPLVFAENRRFLMHYLFIGTFIIILLPVISHLETVAIKVPTKTGETSVLFILRFHIADVLPFAAP
jgi:hypothetical protein